MASNVEVRDNHLHDGTLTSSEAGATNHRLATQHARSFLAALARQLRLSESAHTGRGDDQLGHIIHGIVVPVLLTYVAWVLVHARQNGIGRLYFVARDGEILYRIAQTLMSDRDDIELRYLYGSRRAWLPPSIGCDNATWQRLVVTAGHINSRRDIVERMGLDGVSQEAIRKFLACDVAQWSDPLPYDRARAFLTGIVGNDDASKLVVGSATERRKIVLSYLAQEGLLDDVSWALVDAGWSLNSQACLKRILDAGGTEHHDPKGYYLALDQDHLGETDAGVAYPFVPKPGSIFARRRAVIEHCFLPATHATTSGYRMEGGVALPIFSQELRGEAELAYATRLHEVASTAARLVTTDRNLAATLTKHAGEILANAERLLRHPSLADVKAMSTFDAFIDMRHERPLVKPLCRALQLKDLWAILAMGLSERKSLEPRPFVWLEGSVKLSPIYVRVPLGILLWAGSVRRRLTGTD